MHIALHKCEENKNSISYPHLIYFCDVATQFNEEEQKEDGGLLVVLLREWSYGIHYKLSIAKQKSISKNS